MDVKIYESQAKTVAPDRDHEPGPEQASPNSEAPSSKGCPCTTKQLLIIVIPCFVIALFLAIFLPLYLKDDDDDDDDKKTSLANEYDTFNETIYNTTYATLTPINGFDFVFVFLEGITGKAGDVFDMLKNNSKTFIPKRTKIISLGGDPRVMQFMIDWSNYSLPVNAWFNVDKYGALVYNGSDPFEEAKVSLARVLDEIDAAAKFVNGDYQKVFLGGFSQGAIMTNYVMLNSRHELRGYLPFSGYVFDSHFNPNKVETPLNQTQTEFLNARKDYYILASHSFTDQTVPYANVIPGYYTYYANYPNFKLLSFGVLLHVIDYQPTLPFVRLWLKERMGLITSINDL